MLDFIFSPANLNMDLGKILVYCKSSENQKEIKKPSDKTLRVWAKKQLGWEFVEIFKGFQRKSQWKIDF